MIKYKAKYRVKYNADANVRYNAKYEICKCENIFYVLLYILTYAKMLPNGFKSYRKLTNQNRMQNALLPFIKSNL